MRNYVYSLGYQLRNLEEFVELLQAAGVSVVVDVRETAWSRKPGFSKTALAAGLAAVGIQYQHLPQAGNPKHLRAEATSHLACLEAYDAYLTEQPVTVAAVGEVLNRLLADGQTPCLICYERHPDDCHRSYLLRHWQGIAPKLAEVQHLAPDGAPRLVKPLRKATVEDLVGVGQVDALDTTTR